MIFPLILRYFVIEFANIIFSATQIYYPIIIAMLLMYELWNLLKEFLFIIKNVCLIRCDYILFWLTESIEFRYNFSTPDAGYAIATTLEQTYVKSKLYPSSFNLY
jgi:hypothetical protein